MPRAARTPEGGAKREHGELELKFVLDAAAQSRLLAAGFSRETASTARLRSTYWDTPDGALLAARVALRVRRTPDGWIQTVKGEGDSPFDRFEWEAPVSSESPERAALPPPHMPAGAIVHQHYDRLAPLFITDFERNAWQLRPASTLAIELAADLGEIQAGDRSEPIAELEAERRDGLDAAFYHWALRFARQHELRLTYASKNERGLRLAGRLPAAARAVKAQPVASPADATAGVAAARAVRECIAHFTANVEPLRSSDDPNAVHQARVALRRLRAVVRFFELPAHERAWKQVDTLAKQLTDTIGRLRDADVFAGNGFAPLRDAMPADPAVSAIEGSLARWRDQERSAVRAAATGRDATRMVLTALYLSERLGRALNTASRPADLRAIRFGDFAARRIAELTAKLEARARRAATAASSDADAPPANKTPSDARWHRVRIAAKNLRYALEFAMDALPKRKRTLDALGRLAKLQQRLGTMQDGAMASAVVARALAGQVDAATSARAIGLIDGWIAHARSNARDADHARAQRSVERIIHALRAVRAHAPDQSDSPTSTSSPTSRTG